MTETLPFLIPIFFVTAFLYSIVGFGGGSTYLAVLAFFAVPYESIPKIALLCNLVVVSGGCYFFIKEGHFSFRKVLPFVVSSIPFAYWAGGVVLNKEKFITIFFLRLLLIWEKKELMPIINTLEELTNIMYFFYLFFL